MTRRTAHVRLAAPIAAAAFLLTTRVACQEVVPAEPGRTVRIDRIDVTTRDVFAEEEASGNLIYGLANLLHFTTDPEVVRRELWFEPGDVVTIAEIEELERNLRGLGLFGAVEAELLPTGDDSVNLDLHTRDRFSLIVSASISSTGGVTTFRGDVGESNLFGTGKKVRITGRSDDQDDTLLFTYDDPQLFGTWYRGSVTVGDTTEGAVLAVDAYKPFKHLGDPWSHGASASSIAGRADYYSAGDRVAEVPVDSHSARAFIARGAGPRDVRRSLGVDLVWSEQRYGPASGSSATDIRVPGDTTEFGVGVRGTLDYAREYLKLENLDELDYVQDEQLGVVGSLRLGAVWRDEAGTSSEVQPVVSGNVRWATSPFEETYLTAEVTGAAQFGDDGVRAWEGRTALHAFQQSLPAQTLAASVRFDAAEDLQGLPRQLTLGEDNGLRGYPARQFTGSRMTVVNLEDRIATGLEIWSVHIGAVAFADLGWPGGDSPNSGELFRSVGAGLRFGSSNLLGSNVFRLDVAFPLDEQDGQEFDLSVSFSSGQVFSFFGHAIGLSDDVVGLR